MEGIEPGPDRHLTLGGVKESAEDNSPLDLKERAVRGALVLPLVKAQTLSLDWGQWLL
jgi:hypothetical protein